MRPDFDAESQKMALKNQREYMLNRGGKNKSHLFRSLAAVQIFDEWLNSTPKIYNLALLVWLSLRLWVQGLSEEMTGDEKLFVSGSCRQR